jgi:hypothetical protein
VVHLNQILLSGFVPLFLHTNLLFHLHSTVTAKYARANYTSRSGFAYSTVMGLDIIFESLVACIMVKVIVSIRERGVIIDDMLRSTLGKHAYIIKYEDTLSVQSI